MKIAVLLSGGVDSSVALHRLLDAGYRDVTAFYLKVWLEDELAFLGRCPWEDDLEHARAVCRRAGVPLEVVPLQRPYHQRVVEYTLSELRAGRTPSPDVLCNQRVKFGAFLETAGRSFDRVATGHYGRLARREGAVRLLRGVDPVKDQTYFLAGLDEPQLERALFPLGGLAKREVRSLATSYGLPNARRPDSQGICFLGKLRFEDFVRAHLGERPGPIVCADSGRRLGEHRGYWFHTIGQRRGLGLSGGPWYVVGKDVKTNTVRVAHGARRPAHARRVYHVEPPHWISGPPPREDLSCKLRHGERVVACRLRRAEDGRWTVRLALPDPGVAPGQFTVFYDGDVCLGGARIG